MSTESLTGKINKEEQIILEICINHNNHENLRSFFQVRENSVFIEIIFSSVRKMNADYYDDYDGR